MIIVSRIIGLLAIITIGVFIVFNRMDSPYCEHLTISLPDQSQITVETAVTETEKVQGLSNRDYVAPRHGMLFLFSDRGIYPFWMKETKIPLDIIWLNNKTVVEVASLESENNGHTPSYVPKQKANAVLEINRGEAQTLHLVPGIQVDWPECEGE